MNEQISNLFSSSTLRSGTLLRKSSISFSVKVQSFGTVGLSTSISSFMDIIIAAAVVVGVAAAADLFQTWERKKKNGKINLYVMLRGEDEIFKSDYCCVIILWCVYFLWCNVVVVLVCVCVCGDACFPFSFLSYFLFFFPWAVFFKLFSCLKKNSQLFFYLLKWIN